LEKLNNDKALLTYRAIETAAQCYKSVYIKNIGVTSMQKDDICN